MTMGTLEFRVKVKVNSRVSINMNVK